MKYLEFFCEHWFFSLCLAIFIYVLVDDILIRIHNIFVLRVNQSRNNNVVDLTRIKEEKKNDEVH